VSESIRDKPSLVFVAYCEGCDEDSTDGHSILGVFQQLGRQDLVDKVRQEMEERTAKRCREDETEDRMLAEKRASGMRVLQLKKAPAADTQASKYARNLQVAEAEALSLDEADQRRLVGLTITCIEPVAADSSSVRLVFSDGTTMTAGLCGTVCLQLAPAAAAAASH
jgi:hypothetical protein